MRNRAQCILFVWLTMAASWATAGEPPQKTPVLPAVLVIGDAVYQQAAGGIIGDLKTQAKVVVARWPDDVLPNSSNAIELIDVLLGHKNTSGDPVPEAKRTDWSLIHLNVGLGDLIHRVPNLKSHRNLPYDYGGVITTPPEQYERNLDALVTLIKTKVPKAKIVWANTTPIPASSIKWFRIGSETEYNKIAQRVMKSHGITANDMHTHVLGILKDAKPPIATEDPFNFGKKPVHPPVVEFILRELAGNH